MPDQNQEANLLILEKKMFYPNGASPQCSKMTNKTNWWPGISYETHFDNIILSYYLLSNHGNSSELIVKFIRIHTHISEHIIKWKR